MLWDIHVQPSQDSEWVQYPNDRSNSDLHSSRRGLILAFEDTMEWMECVMCSAGDQERKHLASGET